MTHTTNINAPDNIGQWALAVSIVFLYACSPTQEQLQATDPWIRLAPATAKMMAAYVQLENTSDQTYRIVAANSRAFGSISIHETVETDGQFSMRAVDAIVLPPGQSISLTPGGMHLMLMRPIETLEDGEQVPITLSSDRGENWTIVFSVQRR